MSILVTNKARFISYRVRARTCSAHGGTVIGIDDLDGCCLEVPRLEKAPAWQS